MSDAADPSPVLSCSDGDDDFSDVYLRHRLALRARRHTNKEANTNTQTSGGETSHHAVTVASVAALSAASSISSSFSSVRLAVSRLTVELLMKLTLKEIAMIEREFVCHNNSLSVSQFVLVMMERLSPAFSSLDRRPELFLRALVELFEAMDLDGSASLEFQEFLATIVHLSLSAVDHLGLSQIQPYKRLASVASFTGNFCFQSGAKLLRYIEHFNCVLLMEGAPLQMLVFDPALRRHAKLHSPQSSVLALEFIGRFGGSRAPAVGGASTLPLDYAAAERAPSSALAASQAIERKHNKQHERSKQTSQFYQNSLNLHRPPSTAALGPPSSNGLLDELGFLASSNSASYGRAFDAFTKTEYLVASHRESRHFGWGCDSLVVTASCQYLSVYENPGPATPAFAGPKLTDSKKLRSPYLCLKWSGEIGRLVGGAESGAVDSWRIVNSCGKYDRRAANTQTANTECKLIFDRSFVSHEGGITSLCIIHSMGYLLSGSFDATVKLWEIASGRLRGTFRSHRAAIVAIDYSDQFRFFVSASLDHDVHIFSPFKADPIGRLTGHAAPLARVQFVNDSPQIVSADEAGQVRVWDARSFACVQVLASHAQLTDAIQIKARGALRDRIITVNKQGRLRLFEQIGGEKEQIVGDSVGPSAPVRSDLLDCLYSPVSLSFIACSDNDAQLWSALDNQLLRIYRGLVSPHASITSIAMDARHRKLIVGDSVGCIRLYNIQTGSYIKSLASHAGPVTAIIYCDARRSCLSVGEDRVMKIHDEAPIEEQSVILESRVCDSGEIVCAALSQEAASDRHLAACATSDGQLLLYSIVTAGTTRIRHAHPGAIVGLQFLDPHPLLASADDSGALTLTFTKGHALAGQCAVVAAVPLKAAAHLSAIRYWASRGCLIYGNSQGQVTRVELKPLIDGIIKEAALTHTGDKFQPSRELQQLAHAAFIDPSFSVSLPALSPARPLAGTPVVRLHVIQDPEAIIVVQSDSSESLLLDPLGSLLGAVGLAGCVDAREWRFQVAVERRAKQDEDKTMAVLNQVAQLVKQRDQQQIESASQ